MRSLLIYLIGLSIVVSNADALTLSNATSWEARATFSVAPGVNYVIYKPMCAGSYRLGDILLPYGTTPSMGNYLVCVYGGSNEIREATNAAYITTDPTPVANLAESTTDNVTYKVPGVVALNVFTWTQYNSNSVNISAVGGNKDLRNYGVLTHPNCNLLPCSGSKISSTANFVVYDGLSLLNITTGQMPLYRTANTSGSPDLIPLCLSPKCFCPYCVHGTCNGITSKCTCEPQWRGVNCDADVNECELHTANCDPIATCHNTAPGYTCECPQGYNSTNGGVNCTDIDECSFAGICPGQLCVNLKGSYQCNNCSAGQVYLPTTKTCANATQVYLCGNGVLDKGEECDRGAGCSVNCTCNSGFTPQNTTNCAVNCGNGKLDAGEECDRGLGCLAACICDTSLGYIPNNSTSCAVEPYNDVDPCARFSGCSDCTVFNCLFCSKTGTCSSQRTSSDCSDSCPSNSTTPVDAGVAPSVPSVAPVNNNSTVIGDTPSYTAIGEADAQQELIQKVVPAVVVCGAVLIAGIVVLVVLLKRREKRKRQSVQVKVPLHRMSRSTLQRSMSTSKYGIERNTINSNPDKTWEPPMDSEFVKVEKLPFDMSKKIDFNVGSNQFKVGQQYTDVITITAKDKKSATATGFPFAFHAPSTKKLKMEFNPSSGIVKKSKPVEVEVTMTMQMTTEIDVDIGVECSAEQKHSYIMLHLMSELSPFIDLDEVVLEGGSSAKPVGDGAFGVVYKGKYRAQDVAVKMLKMQDMPEEMLDEFDREVDLMNKLRHKNIVQFIGASKVVGRFALVTEFIDKGNIADVVLNANKTLSYGLKLRVALDAARAMLFLHENKILHRDLKLDNLLCVSTNPDDRVVSKLTDFGTSRAVSEKISNSYTVGVGTPMYMSPEILAKKPYDTKSDVFSYGVMLWILYCQREPYKNVEHSWEVARFVMEGNREKIPKECPMALKELIEQCWAQEPSQRPEFEQIVTRLEQMLQEDNKASVSPGSSLKLKKSLK